MQYLKLAFQVLLAIPQALSAIREIMNWWLKLQRQKAAEEAKKAVDEAIKSGDQRPIEHVIGNPNAGKPSDEKIPDLKTRPVRDRSADGL